MKIVFDPAALTLGDMVDFKAKTGESVTEAFEPKIRRDKETGEVLKDGRGRPVKKADIDPLHLAALVWLTGRKANPGFTFEDALNMPLGELDMSEVEEDPKDSKN